MPPSMPVKSLKNHCSDLPFKDPQLARLRKNVKKEGKKKVADWFIIWKTKDGAKVVVRN